MKIKEIKEISYSARHNGIYYIELKKCYAIDALINMDFLKEEKKSWHETVHNHIVFVYDEHEFHIAKNDLDFSNDDKYEKVAIIDTHNCSGQWGGYSEILVFKSKRVISEPAFDLGEWLDH